MSKKTKSVPTNKNTRSHTVCVRPGKFMHKGCRKIKQVGVEADKAAMVSLFQAAADCPPRLAPGPVDLHSIAGLRSHLRRWADDIAPPCRDGDDDDDAGGERAQRRMFMRRYLLELDALAASLDGNAWFESRRSPHIIINTYTFNKYDSKFHILEIPHIRHSEDPPRV